MKNKINHLAILTFYIIAIGLRYVSNKTSIGTNISSDIIRVLFQGIGPAVGALVVFSVFKIKPALTLKGNYKAIVSPVLLYWVFPVVLIAGVEYFTKGTFTGLISVPVILVYGLLEEIGWRGFLQQQLKPLPEFLNILIVAVLWFIWHLRFDFTSSNLLFFGILILGTWGIGKVADTTHSFLTVAAFHSLNNFFTEMNQKVIVIILILVSVWVVSLIIRKKQTKKSIAELSSMAD